MSPRLFALLLALSPTAARAFSANAAPAAAPAAQAAGAAPAENADVTRVDPSVLARKADFVRDVVLDSNNSDVTARETARSYFDELPSLGVPVHVIPRTDRERVRGEMATVEGLQREAEERLKAWRERTREVPPPDLQSAVETTRSMNDGEKLDFEGGMPENQMGVFRYMEGAYQGVIRMNEHLRLMAALIGPAFVFATLAHEGAHARDRAARKLDPKDEIAGEISAFKTQYQWLMIMDPLGERLMVLRSTLDLKLRKKFDPITAMAKQYLDHLVSVRETAGDERSLRKLVEKLGYGASAASSRPVRS